LEVTHVSSGAVTELSFDRIYSNIATVSVDAFSASDPSHYRNPPTPVDQAQAYKRFFVVDTYVDKSFEYDSDGTPLENNQLASTNYAPRGITMTVDGQTNWVVDKYNGVFVYDADGNSLGQWDPGSLSRPEGIATNETDIWIVDNGSNKVYFYAGAASRLSGSQSPDSSFALAAGNNKPSGITMAGQTIWVVNDGRYHDDVFVYDLSGNLQGSWRLSYNVNPRGITINPGDVNDIWIVDNKYDKVYEYTGGAFFTSGTHSPDTKWRLAATNRKPQGIADPPPPVAGNATQDNVAQDRALAGFASLLDQMASKPGDSRVGNLLQSAATDRPTIVEVPQSQTNYAAFEVDKESLFAEEAEELDLFNEEDDTTLDAVFSELGETEDELSEVLISAQ
jgi:hypothetical protein